MRALFAALALLLMGAGAHAQVHHGNDAVTLSVANEFEAHVIAAQFCARGDKYTIIRVHGRYGDEIAINCLSATPAPRSAGMPSSQPATSAMTELYAQLQRGLTSLSAVVRPEMPAAGKELIAQLQRALTPSSAPAQPEMPAGEKDPPARPEHDSPARPERESVTPNTYAQAW
jgi:hypothetical protein